MKLTEREKNLVKGVFGELLSMQNNGFLGSVTIEEMQKLYNKIRYEGYCKRRGITFEEMTEEDTFMAYEELEDERAFAQPDCEDVFDYEEDHWSFADDPRYADLYEGGNDEET